MTNGLTVVSVDCLHRLVSHIRRLPSVERVRHTDFGNATSTKGWVTDFGLGIAERLVDGAARQSVARIIQRNGRELVRIIRTERRPTPVPIPRPRGGDGVAVREIPFRLPLVVLSDGVAILEDPLSADHTGELVVVQDRACVASLIACHALIWSVGAVEGQAPVPTLPAHLERLLVELSRGATDAQAARNMHVSLRTLSRHVAELLKFLGARSRLQAGVAAVRNGLV